MVAGDTNGFSRILEERVAGLCDRVESIEATVAELRKEFRDILVELKVLQTRVSLYAAAISLGVSLLQNYLH